MNKEENNTMTITSYNNVGLDNFEMFFLASPKTDLAGRTSNDLSNRDNRIIAMLENYYINYYDPINAQNAVQAMLIEAYGGSMKAYQQHLKAAGKLVVKIYSADVDLDSAKKSYYNAICRNLILTDYEEKVDAARCKLRKAEEALKRITDRDENIKAAMETYVLARKSQNGKSMYRVLTELLQIIYENSEYQTVN